MTEQKVSLSFYSSVAFLCVLKHFNNGNAVPMRSGSFLTMGTAFPRVPPRNDTCAKLLYGHFAKFVAPCRRLSQKVLVHRSRHLRGMFDKTSCYSLEVSMQNLHCEKQCGPRGHTKCD